MLAQLVPVEEFGFLLQQVAGVGQQDLAQVERPVGAIHLAPKAAAGEQRQVAAVVQVGMGQHDRINLVRRDRQTGPVAQAQRLVALKQAAVHQQRFGAVAHQVLGAGDGAGAPQKSNVDAHVEFSRFGDVMPTLCTKKCHEDS